MEVENLLQPFLTEKFNVMIIGKDYLVENAVILLYMIQNFVLLHTNAKMSSVPLKRCYFHLSTGAWYI